MDGLILQSDSVLIPQLAIRLLHTGTMEFWLNGAVGSNYVIEVSTNLSGWNVLTNVTMSQPAVVCQDPPSPIIDRRFYRAVSY